MCAGFDRNVSLSLHKDLGLPVLQFPQLQSREILPMIILPQSDVVMKMARKSILQDQKKKKKKPPPNAYCRGMLSVCGVC